MSANMTQADRIIGKFEGVRALATALGHKHPTTVQGWKDRGVIPSRQHQAIWDAAQRTGVELELRDFAAVNGHDSGEAA